MTKILLVDADADLLRLTRLALIATGCEILEATSGEAALSAIWEHRPALVLLEVDLPAMSGFEVCRAVKSEATLDGIFVTILTGSRITEEDRVQGLACGADDYLVRPISDRELLARVQAMLRICDNGQALRAAAQYWQVAFVSVNDAFLLTDADFTVMQVNPAAERLFGQPARQLLGQKCFSIVHGTSAPIPACPLKEVRRTKRRQSLIIEEADRCLEVHVEPVLDSAGMFTGSVHIISDITERRRAEQERNLLTYTITASLNEIFLFDGDTLRFKFVNEGALANLQITLEQALQLTPVDIKPEFDLASFQRLLVPLQTGEQKTLVFETNHRRADGSLYPIEVHLQLFQKENIFLAVIQDITERRKSQLALQESEEKLRLIFDHAFDGISIHEELPGRSRRLIDCNQRYAEMAGRSKEELLALSNLSQVQRSADPARSPEENLHIRQNRLPYRGVFSWLRPDGRENVIEYTAVPVQLGERPITIGIDRDITERKRVEDALHQAEEKYRTLVEQVPMITYEAELGGRSRYISPQIEAFTGFTAAEWLADPDLWLKQVHPQDRQRVLDANEAAVLNNEKYVSEYRLFTKDGRLKWIYDEGRPIGSADGKFFLRGICQDITGRKRAEVALQESEDRYRDLVENVHDLVCTHDLEGKVLSVNQAAVDLTGYTVSELVGSNLRDWLPAEHRHHFDAYLATIKRDGKAAGLMTVRIKNGERRIWEYHNTLRIEGVAEPVARGYARDVTEQRRAEQALRESEARFATVFHANPAPIAITRLSDSKLVEINAAWEDLMGYTRAEALGHTVLELGLGVNPEQRASLVEAVRAQKKGRGEVQIRCKSGEIRDLLMSAELIELSGEYHLLTMAQDITDLKQVDRALRESEMRFRSLYENATIGMYRTTPDGRILMANAALVRMLGYNSFEELAQRDLAREGYEPEYLRREFQERIERDGEIIGLESAWKRKDGSVIFVRESARMERAEDGSPLYYEGTVEDVTARKQAENALRESEDKFKYIFDHSVSGKSITLVSGEINVNQAFCEMLGYSSGELQNRNWQSITYPEDIELSQRVIDQLLSGEKESTRFIKRYLRKDGSVIWADVGTALRRDASGQPLYFLTTANDITERKQAELALQENERRINRLLDQQIVINQLALALGESLDLNTIYQTIYHHIRVLADAWIFIVSSFDEPSLLIRAEYAMYDGEPLDVSGFPPLALAQSGQGNQSQVIYTGQPLYVPDHRQAREKSQKRYAIEKNGTVYDLSQEADSSKEETRSALYVPMKAKGKIIGVMQLQSRQLDAYSRDDIQLLDSMANVAAVAIQNTNLYQEVQYKLGQRNLTEEALHTLSARQKAILAAIPDILMEVDQNKVYVWANPAGIEFFGPDVIGKEADDYFEGEQKTYQLVQPLFNGDENTIYVESWQRRQDGKNRLLAWWCRVLKDSRGDVVGALSSARDITEASLAQEQIRQLNAELEQRVEERTRELREAQEKLLRQERLAVMGQLAGGVGHELRNPLAVINNAVYFLKLVQPDASEKVKQYLGMIEKETRTADKIISDLLDFARIKSVDREAVAAPELVGRVLERYPAPAPVTVKLDFPAGLPKAFADPRQIEQVLGNLIVNACQAMPEGGQLTVSAATRAVENNQPPESVALPPPATAHYLMIAVTDTGVGIPPENMSKLFEPLFTTKAKGIGLGLAVCKKLVEANEGCIEVHSEPGVGSSFTVCLPIYGGAP